MTRPTEPRWPICGLAVLLVFISLQNVWVVERDTIPAAADESGYYRAALAWRAALSGPNLRQARPLLFHGDPRPPLVPLLTGALFAVCGGGSIQLARHANLPFFWLAVIATFALGVRLGRRRSIGLLAAALLAAYPQIAGFSRLYWMDVPLAAMTALCAWLTLGTEDLQRRSRCVILGVALGLGALTKYSFIVFIAGPLALAVLRGWRIDHKRALVHTALIVLCAGAIAGLWYGPTLGAAWFNYLYNQGLGALAARPWWTFSNLAGYARWLPTDQLGWIPFCALLLALPGFWRGVIRDRAFLLLWVAVPYLFFTYGLLGIAWSRFTLPYLPALALITALGLSRWHGAARCGSWAIGIACMAIALVSPHVSAPSSPTAFVWERAISRGLSAPGTSDFYLQISRLAPAGARFAAVFPDHGTTASVLSSFSAEQGDPLLFISPEAPPGLAAFPRSLSEYSLVVRVLAPGETPTLRSLPQLRQVEHEWHQIYSSYRLISERRIPNGYRLLFYRRV